MTKQKQPKVKELLGAPNVEEVLEKMDKNIWVENGLPEAKNPQKS